MIRKTLTHLRPTLQNRIKYGLVVINEYTFFIDFKGMMHFDDSDFSSGKNVIRDVKFVNKFYQTLQKNNT